MINTDWQVPRLVRGEPWGHGVLPAELVEVRAGAAVLAARQVSLIERRSEAKGPPFSSVEFSCGASLLHYTAIHVAAAAWAAAGGEADG